MKRLWVIFIFLAIISLLVLSGCQKSSSTTQATTTSKPATTTTSTTATQVATSTTSTAPQIQYGGTLRIVMAFQLSNIGYTPTISGAMAYPVDPVYEGLIWGNMKTGERSPWLAESFEKDPAGKSITIKMRPGIKFHDDTDCDAQAVKDFLTLKMSKQKGWLANVQSIDIIDPLTFKLNTTSVDTNTLVQLGEAISSPKWLAQGEDVVAFHPVGTGPYKFSDYKQNAYLKYTRFDNYWAGKPPLDGVDIILVPDVQTQVSTLLAGQADIVYSVPFQDTERVKAAGFVFKTITPTYQGFCPDSVNAKSIFSNPKLAQAVNCAINKENIAKSLGYGYMNAAYSVIPPDVPSYQPLQGYDVAKAKQLMTEAGYPNGFETTLITCLMANSDAMVAVQSDLDKVGIKAKIDLADMGRWFSARMKGWENALLFVNGIYGQPYLYYYSRTWSKAQPDSYVSAARPAGFDDNLAKLMASDASSSTPLLQTLAKSMEDSGMYIPFITQGQVCAISPKVHDYGIFNDTVTQAGWFKYKCWMSK
jgi:peptide/nickel transport system substrate-binding protein